MDSQCPADTGLGICEPDLKECVGKFQKLSDIIIHERNIYIVLSIFFSEMNHEIEF